MEQRNPACHSVLTIEKISKNIAGKILLDQADLLVHPGERVGLIGPNGTGKTTLLRMILGEVESDAGSIRLRGGTRIGLLRQEIRDAGQTLLAETLSGDEELTALRQERLQIESHLQKTLPDAEHAQQVARMGEIDLRLAAIHAYSAEGRAATILTGLGFATEDLLRPLHDFSGGWRMRSQLARLLFSSPDLLLLDEPTNHLDLESAAWLENHLKKNAGAQALIIVSHDRAFLNRATTVTVELENGRLTRFSGPFDAWLEQKATLLNTLEKQAAQTSRRREELECFIRRFRAKATKAKQVQSRIKALERLEPVAMTAPSARPPRIRFPTPPACSQEVIRIRRLKKSYGEKTILSEVNLEIKRAQKIGLVGINGAGKSTLLKLIAGDLTPDGGSITLGDRVQVARFAQHAQETLQPQQSVLESAAAAAPPHYGETALRSLLGGLLFSGDAVKTRVADLSGGERVRLALAHLFLSGANLLLLDEPANHLDMAARAALEEALSDYPGAVMLVTHDRDLMEAACEALWVVANGQVTVWEGSLEGYLEQAIHAISTPTPLPNSPSPATGSLREIRRQSAQIRDRLRQETQGARRQLEHVEKKIATLEEEQHRLQAILAAPDAYAAEFKERLKNDMARLGQLENELHNAMATWEQLSLEIAEREAAAEQALARLRANDDANQNDTP
ncbi:MAG: ABC-F family ATP-binding cassette domain-containing protein [Magnetococcales bacterium]|nr:ABC-F family ATP-binding cassette domain-containing protein [Magnetococcales bacterium]NGZ06261.1 ABC-F family ATP-binding cassette domain-containing protein [Magnetococcales bacterium]